MTPFVFVSYFQQTTSYLDNCLGRWIPDFIFVVKTKKQLMICFCLFIWRRYNCYFFSFNIVFSLKDHILIKNVYASKGYMLKIIKEFRMKRWNVRSLNGLQKCLLRNRLDSRATW